MGADVEHQIATLDELAIEPVHGRRARPIAVIDAQRADDAAGGPKGVEHRVKPRWAVETALAVSIAGSIKRMQRGRRRYFFGQPPEADTRGQYSKPTATQ